MTLMCSVTGWLMGQEEAPDNRWVPFWGEAAAKPGTTFFCAF